MENMYGVGVKNRFAKLLIDNSDSDNEDEVCKKVTAEIINAKNKKPVLAAAKETNAKIKNKNTKVIAEEKEIKPKNKRGKANDEFSAPLQAGRDKPVDRKRKNSGKAFSRDDNANSRGTAATNRAPEVVDESHGKSEKVEDVSGNGAEYKNESSPEAVSGAEGPEEEPEKPLMTLEQYKALLETRQPKEKPVFNVRKAGEGEDQSWMKKMTLKKKERISDEADDEEEEIAEDPKRFGRQKHLLEVKFQFSDSRRGFRGGRGRGGFGGNRGYKESVCQEFVENDRRFYTPAPKVDDERDFPSLGNK